MSDVDCEDFEIIYNSTVLNLFTSSDKKVGSFAALDWLESLDKVSGLGMKTDHIKSSKFRWPALNFISGVSWITGMV